MEITETEVKTEDVEIADIYTTPYLFHATFPDKLREILSQGILSPRIMKRSKVNDIYEMVDSVHDIVFLSDPTKILPINRTKVEDMLYRVPRNPGPRIVFLVEPSVSTSSTYMPGPLEGKLDVTRKLRVAPKFIHGVIVNPDDERTNPMITNEMQDLANTQHDIVVPVYAVNGDLIWPKNILHEDIVNSLGVHK